MDALTYLREDHKSVLGMLEVLDGAPTGSGADVDPRDRADRQLSQLIMTALSMGLLAAA